MSTAVGTFEARRQAEEAQRKEQMARQAAQLKAQQAAEAQRWIALAAQHRAERERLVPVAPGVWARVGEYPTNGRGQATAQMTLAEWKQQDMAETQITMERVKQQQATAYGPVPVPTVAPTTSPASTPVPQATATPIPGVTGANATPISPISTITPDGLPIAHVTPIPYDIPATQSANAPGFVGDLFANTLDEGANFAVDYFNEFKDWTMRFNARPSGNISVSGASDDVARELFGLLGGSARRAETITDAIRPAMLENALPLIDESADSFLGKIGGPLLTGGLSFLVNAAEYATDPSLDKGNMWQRIGIGTGVDISLDIGIGVASAALTSWLVPLAIGAGVVASAPAWAPFAVATLVAFGTGAAFDYFDWSDAIKNNINDFVDDIQGD